MFPSIPPNAALVYILIISDYNKIPNGIALF